MQLASSPNEAFAGYNLPVGLPITLPFGNGTHNTVPNVTGAIQTDVV
jgi:hypothetical protein